LLEKRLTNIAELKIPRIIVLFSRKIQLRPKLMQLVVSEKSENSIKTYLNAKKQK